MSQNFDLGPTFYFRVLNVKNSENRSFFNCLHDIKTLQWHESNF